ncbi:MAG: hypothetical protein HY785_03180 [Oscillatoriophycideae cyanobacterium NC_groundwater_1537_Pr4_S-0.65um_50_18]|nr:hypothetical protein [Oscillatoriophycideae cyanobacterium NC_groundwater_1537_Pr4_S-0.65um_50_18]
MKRRNFLKLTAASAVTVVVAGGVWRSYDRGVWSTGTGPAYEPWETWRTDRPEGALALVRSAILAASPHNTQPWIFQVTSSQQSEQIDVYADTRRHLGAMDPYLREMRIGLGCAIENMLLAAQAEGYRAQLTLDPGTLAQLTADLDPQRVATLRLSSGQRSTPELYDAIPNRRTNRAAYDLQRSVAPEALASLATLAKDQAGLQADLKLFLLVSDPERQRFSTGTLAATEAIVADPTMSQDGDRWFRSSWQDLQKQRSGVHIDASGLPWMMRSLVKMLPSVSPETQHQSWISSTKTALDTSPAFGLIAVRDLYDQPQALQAGRLWQRIHLWATTQGLAMQPLNQLPERVDREQQLGKAPQTAELLAQVTQDASWKPTFAFRLGYPTSAALASARRPIEDVVMNAKPT